MRYTTIPADSPGAVRCKWCGAPTYATTLAECDMCWEIRIRAEYRPGVAQKIIKAVIDAEDGH